MLLCESLLDALFAHRRVPQPVLTDERDDLGEGVGFADRMGSPGLLLEGLWIVRIKSLQPPAEG